MKKIVLLAAATCVAFAPGIAAAAPGGQSGPSANSVETVDGFVCPVIRTDKVLNSPHGHEIAGGHYTIFGPDHLRVPIEATNQDGAGDPMGEHAAPGDEDYTAIWNIC